MLPGVDTALVTDLAATLFAAEAAGVAAWCLRTAVDYAKLREQFGKPIGSFQAIKHLCAEMLCRVELATAVAWDAAQAVDDPPQRPIASATAAAVALDAAVETAKDCIQVLGGIGFTWEHDAHLYLRRALALRQLLGGSAGWRRRVAELTLAGRPARAGHRRRLPAPRSATRPRAEAARIAALPGRRAARRAGRRRLPRADWPDAVRPGARPVAEQLVIDEELTAHGVTRPDLVIAGWAIPTILRHGSPEQIERFIAPDAARRDRVVPAVQRARRRFGPGRAAHPGRHGSRAAGGCPARRCGRRSPARRTSRSAWPAPIRTRPSTRASATSSST